MQRDIKIIKNGTRADRLGIVITEEEYQLENQGIEDQNKIWNQST